MIFVCIWGCGILCIQTTDHIFDKDKCKFQPDPADSIIIDYSSKPQVVQAGINQSIVCIFKDSHFVFSESVVRRLANASPIPELFRIDRVQRASAQLENLKGRSRGRLPVEPTLVAFSKTAHGEKSEESL